METLLCLRVYWKKKLGIGKDYGSEYLCFLLKQVSQQLQENDKILNMKIFYTVVDQF